MKGTQLLNFVTLRESGGITLLERASTSKMGKTYKGVILVKVGMGNNRDRNYYPAETLKEAADSGSFEGLRAFADHPTAVDEQILPERSIRDVVGIYTNTKFRESQSGGKVVGDLTVFEHHSWLSNMVDQLIKMNQSDKVGISINGSGKTVPRKVHVSESGELEDVNYLESFLRLRSADVVTEAGAGGGWEGVKQILESANGAKRGKAMLKVTKEQQARLKEAADKGDLDEVDKIMTEIKEASKPSDGKTVDKGVKPLKSTESVEEADADDTDPDADPDADDTDPDADPDADDTDPDKDLEESAERIITASEEVDDEQTADVNNPDEDPEEMDLEETATQLEDEAKREKHEPTKQAMLRGLNSIRAAIARRSEAREAAGNLNSTVKGAKRGAGNLNSTVKGAAAGGGKKMKVAGTPPPAQKLKESDADLNDRASSQRVRLLETQLDTERKRSNRLSSQLSVRQSADRAKKLLRESAIPETLRPKILPQLVGKSEAEMANVIEYHEALVSTVIREVAAGDSLDELDAIEGSGSQIRESFGARGGDQSDLFASVGLPLKQQK